MTGKLPAGFEALEPFVATWALATTAERAQRRSDSTPAEREAFYQAGKDLIAPALDHLDTRPLDALSPPEQALMNLALAYAHVVLAVEIQGPDEPRHAELRKTMHIVRSPSDAVA